MSLKPERIDTIPDAVIDALDDLDVEMRSVVAQALSEPLIADKEATRQALARASSKAKGSIDTAVVSSVSSAARESLAADEAVYANARIAGLVAPYAPAASSVTLTRLLSDGIATATNMANLVRTSAEQAVYAEFTAALDSALLGITTNVASPQSAIRNAVTTIAQTTTKVTYTSAAGQRIEMSVYAASRRAILTAANQTTLRMQDARFTEVGGKYVEITSHMGSRPEHADWQGQVMLYTDLPSRTGYGEVDGLGGANCRHSWFPFFPGMSEPMSATMIPNESENEEAYALSQRQRLCERNVRKYAGQGKVYAAGGQADKAKAAKARAKAWRGEADKTAKARGGSRRRDREVPR